MTCPFENDTDMIGKKHGGAFVCLNGAQADKTVPG